MSFGKIYCESWWGAQTATNSWGIIYPSCGDPFTVDSTAYRTDTTAFRTDRTVI